MGSLKDEELETDQQLYLLGNTQQSLSPVLCSTARQKVERAGQGFSLA